MAVLLQRPGFAGSLVRFWHRSYASDYVGLLLLIILDGLIQAYVKPFHRMFRIDNQTLHFPFTKPAQERVSVAWLFIFCMGIPSLVLFIWAVALRPSLHKIHVTTLGLFISIFLTVFVTDTAKNAIGRPRPDLRARCLPHLDTPRNELVTFAICEQPNEHILHEGWRSFPSGHSSFSFAGLGYLFLFFAAQFQILHPGTSLPTMLLSLAPLLGAALIAISRLEDYRHDVYDVTAGAILGFTIAWLTYRRYYPSLRNSRCDTPYPSKTDMMAAAAKWHARRGRDEEAMVGLRNAEHMNFNSKNGHASRGASGDDSDDDVDTRGVMKSIPAGR